MPIIKVSLEEPAWPDIADKAVIHLGRDAAPIQIAALSGGMSSGAPSVAIRIDLPDGRIVVAETSLRLFQMANAALLGRFGDVT